MFSRFNIGFSVSAFSPSSDKILFDSFSQGIGGICYQAFYQRVLSTATDTQAKITCYAASVLCPILGLPSIIIGATAASTSTKSSHFLCHFQIPLY